MEGLDDIDFNIFHKLCHENKVGRRVLIEAVAQKLHLLVEVIPESKDTILLHPGQYDWLDFRYGVPGFRTDGYAKEKLVLLRTHCWEPAKLIWWSIEFQEDADQLDRQLISMFLPPNPENRQYDPSPGQHRGLQFYYYEWGEVTEQIARRLGFMPTYRM